MALLLPVLMGFVGGIALPQDPIPVRVGKSVNPDADPTDGPPKFIPPWPYCQVCQGVNGAVVAVAVLELAGPALALTGFFENAAMSLAAGAVGSAVIGGAWGLMRKR
jgi:hypothetical protein